MTKKTGFSLIELLVVITIIGVLAAIGLASYRTANAKARDSKRQADIQAIQSALEVYRSTKGEYPPSLEDINSSTYFSTGKRPEDPNGAECAYTYIRGETTYTYTLSFCLETDDLSRPIIYNNP